LIGFQENRANELIVENGKLTGEVREPILGRATKLATLIELTESFDLDDIDTLVVGDGANDLSMIEHAGLGVAYHASRRSPPLRRRGSTTAISRRCSTRRGIGGTSLWNKSRCHHPPPGPASGRPDDRLQRVIQYSRELAFKAISRGVLDTPLSRGMTSLHAQRYKSQFAVAIGDQEQHGFLAVLLQLLDPLFDVGGATDRLLRHLDDDVAGGKPLVGGVGRAVDNR